jgi:hypothetical protein
MLWTCPIEERALLQRRVPQNSGTGIGLLFSPGLPGSFSCTSAQSRERHNQISPPATVGMVRQSSRHRHVMGPLFTWKDSMKMTSFYRSSHVGVASCRVSQLATRCDRKRPACRTQLKFALVVLKCSGLSTNLSASRCIWLSIVIQDHPFEARCEYK